ncbi:peptide chain release factor N(5)-glutamine methyltransferase [Sporolactobacillus sp. THM19-2]|jgi:release factor glutamine methyltransferase|uniref:peptide chain release factor N(5)-glutamine methyltransferase n=1 Tax=Sporolactobacillus sp. THM19-2 TaxID=2511171 RepID=UPI0010202265|nr:peptide chain release factor N(5)-glutamine methyltransferase [Sporolactobacillus sp. THM19-2]RYL94012.1 peptide chain release factor N(5)-glutamine methyltransferase [Sporolactobacillus sp. THM19-2]
MTLRRYEALKWASAFLKENHRDENIGEILLCSRLHLSRTDLFVNNRDLLTRQDEAWFRERVAEHVKTGAPVQYMLGQAPFYGRMFKVTPAVLIPRQETEELVYRIGKWAGRFFPDKKLEVCDIGTGSGAIAITLALEHPDWHVTATDISCEALAVAGENARHLGAKVDFRPGDLTVPLAGLHYDILVSNPPYISRTGMEQLDDTVKDFEPHLALFGGGDGLDCYRQILRGVTAFSTGPLFLLGFEIGAEQGQAISGLIRSTFPNRIEALAVEKDIAGLDRNVLAVLRKK